MRRPAPEMLAGLAAALLCFAMLALFWPGIAMFDSLVQYRQVLTGSYDDWHPPAMARLWSLFHGWWNGQAPMFVLQVALYWLGLGLFAAALVRTGRRIAGLGVLLLGIWPPLVGWQVAVLKDGQMAGALLAASGIAAWWRLDARPLPRWAAALVVLLLVYATLVRINAVFATVPLAFGLLGTGEWNRPFRRGAAILAGIVAVLVATPLVNHGLFRAEPSDVGHALPVYDLAGIVQRAGPTAVPALPAGAWQAAEAEHCINPILWDPLAERCAFIADGLSAAEPGHRLTAVWIAAIARHPLAYAGHRLAHWNATVRWFVPWRFPLAEPQSESEPNTLGLGSPAPWTAPWQRLAGTLAESPLGAPILWLAAALGLLALAWPGRDARARLALALTVSAALTEFAFLVISIASDYRYHLWAMLATGLAAALVLRSGLPRRRARIALAAFLLVGISCLAARMALPPLGAGYLAAIE